MDRVTIYKTLYRALYKARIRSISVIPLGRIAPAWLVSLSLVIGPTVPVWADPGAANSVVEFLAETFSDREADSPSVLARVAATGKLVAGTRTDAPPFASRNAKGEWQGYSIDLLERIRSQLQQELRRPVTLELVPLEGNGLSMVTENQVELVCGSTSFTRSRDLQVDFSLGYFVTGTQLLINPDNRLGREFVIGSVAGTTNQQLIQELFPIARLVTVENRQVGLESLINGRIDAFASDGILLEAMRQSWIEASLATGTSPATLPEADKTAVVPPSSDLEIVPDQPLDQETYACMLPQGDLAFQQLVNASLLDFMQGVLVNNPQDVKLFDRWFGPTGAVPIDQQPLRRFFEQQVAQHISQPASPAAQMQTDLP